MFSLEFSSKELSFSPAFPCLKVIKFQNEFMKSSLLPKYEQKVVKISTLTTQGRDTDNFLFVFWEKQWLHKFILKFTDLYIDRSVCNRAVGTSQQIFPRWIEPIPISGVDIVLRIGLFPIDLKIFRRDCVVVVSAIAIATPLSNSHVQQISYKL